MAAWSVILFRSYLKKVFWPKIFVGAVFLILEILKYCSGLKRGPAAILNQNPIFEMAASGILPILISPRLPVSALNPLTGNNY